VPNPITLMLPARPTSAALARKQVRRYLSDLGLEAVESSAELVASELVTNAVCHGTGPIELRLSCASHRLRIGVFDGDSRSVRRARRDPGPASSSGRGLQIVGAVCAEWGIDAQDRGKVVWAELPLEPIDVTGSGTRHRVVP
jgi:anti-sigma regulatory factor (Ser/Thr protein kinase)